MSGSSLVLAESKLIWNQFLDWADLTDFSLLPCRCPPKLVETDLKPLIDAFVEVVIFVTYFLATEILFQCLHTGFLSDVEV